MERRVEVKSRAVDTVREVVSLALIFAEMLRARLIVQDDASGNYGSINRPSARCISV